LSDKIYSLLKQLVEVLEEIFLKLGTDTALYRRQETKQKLNLT